MVRLLYDAHNIVQDLPKIKMGSPGDYVLTGESGRGYGTVCGQVI